MHKKVIDYKEISFVLIITLLFCLPLFMDKMYVSYDSFFHMNRLVGLLGSFRDHQLMPKIYPYTNNGYGYASPLFYCDLLVYPFSIMYGLGVPLVISYKMMLGFYTFLSIVSIFYVSKKIFVKKHGTSYLLTFLYTFCNYHIYDVYGRGALGEIFAFVFIPLIFLAIYKIFYMKENAWVLLGASFSLLLMSHNLTFSLICISFAAFIIFYIIANIKNITDIKNRLITVTKAAIFAILLSSWFLFPMLEQMLDQKFNLNYLSDLYDLKNSVPEFKAFLNPIASIEKNSEKSFGHTNIGIIYMILPIFYLFLKKEFRNKYATFIFVTIYCLILAAAGFGVEFLKPFVFIQFLFRFLIVCYPMIVFLMGYIFECLDKKKRTIVLSFISLFSIYNILNFYFRMPVESKQYLDNYAGEEIYNFDSIIDYEDHNSLEISGGEYLPVTEKVNYLKETKFIKEVTEDGYLDIIYDYDRYFTKVDFTFDFENKKTIMLPLTYYKGYKAYKVDNGEYKEIKILNIPEYKKVGFCVDAGLGTYHCEYVGTTVQKASLVISSITAIYTILYYYKYRPYNKVNK